jgi:divalent metal cation (Fe/Co/Zn/Cd) transporter
LAVAAIVAKVGWDLGTRTIAVLVDAAPAGVADEIEAILRGVPAVARVERVRARIAGSSIVADAVVAVAPGTPIEDATAICAAARAAVAEKHPEIDLTLGAEPLALDQASVEDTVRHVAAGLGCAVHDVSVYHVRDGGAATHVSFDVELDGSTPLAEAHAQADALERAVAAQLGDGVVVRSHLDPLRPDPIDAAPVSPARERELVAAIRAAAAEVPSCRSTSDVTVRSGEDGLAISVSCGFAADLPLAIVHAATFGIERRIRRDVPDAARVIVHAEPV